MLMFSISMLNVSPPPPPPPPPPPLWQVRRQLATPFLLTVPSPNLGLCAHEGRGEGLRNVQIVVRRRRRRRRNKGSGVFLQPVKYQLLLRFDFGCVY